MPLPDPNASDWSELDLLMVADADERLGAERTALLARIEELTASGYPDSPQVREARHRLGLVDRSLARAMQGTTVVPPGRVRTRGEVAETPGPPD